MQPNVFSQLFQFRSRPGINPEENFLTTAFAYVLATDKQVCIALLNEVCGEDTGDSLSGEPNVEPHTARPTDPLAGAYVYPDMEVHISFKDGTQRTVRFEHKWRSRLSVGQLATYKALDTGATRLSPLVFISSIEADVESARNCCDRSFAWSEIAEIVEKSAQSQMAREFVEFLRTHGLATRVVSEAVEKIRELEAEILSLVLHGTAYSWDAVPVGLRMDRPVRRLEWDRVGIYFGASTLAQPSAIFAGFRLGAKDLRLPLMDQGGSPDLFLAIHSKPAVTPDVGVLEKVSDRLRASQQAANRRVQVIPFSRTKNKWHKITVLESLRDVTGSDRLAESHASLVYSRLHEWLGILFEGGELEAALHDVWREKW